MGQRQKFNIISLGCARNLVDSEVMAGVLHQNDYELVRDPEAADIVLINTCGFIAAAKEESIDTILDVARLKEAGKLKKLVVAGCLSQRFPNELAKELPEVDLFIGTGEVPRIAQILKEHEAHARRQYVGLPSYLYDHNTPRVLSTGSYTAFVKVSEGCDHKCAFCIIPQMRGPHRSRSVESIVSEICKLTENGVKEINLIAQDLTAYGRDRKDGTTLEALLRELAKVPKLQWLRLLYAYPNFLDDRLLEVIRDSEKICKYIDIPFQHISQSILRRMRRGKSGSSVREALQKLRQFIPGLTLRTSLIVGFPGETEADFRQLLDFVEEAQFERLGVFKYSPEEGTAASRMGADIPEQVKERRWQEVMDLQSVISRKNNQALIGTMQRVMIDDVALNSKRVTGRTQGHAPEVDGVVYVETGDSRQKRVPVRPGDMIDVTITGALDYDLISETVNA